MNDNAEKWEQADLEDIPEESGKPRDLDKLLNLEYSEMTEEEIGIVIEYKAAILARDREHDERMEMLRVHMDEQAAINMAIAESAQNTLDELTRHAIGRFEDESNG